MDWRVDDLGIDPVSHAQRWDYHLSPSAPIYPNSNFYPQPTALQIDQHEGVEVGIVLTGRQERHFEHVVRTADPGDIWLCAPWEPHGWRIAAHNSRDIVLIFLPEFLGDERFGSLSWLSLFAVPPRHRPGVASPDMRAAVLGLGRAILQETLRGEAASRVGIRLDLLRLLFTVSRDWRPPPGTTTQSAVPATNIHRIIPAVRLVHASPGRRVSVSEAAAACRLGRSQFCYLFRHTMGLAFGRFCLRARLARAADRILNTRMSTEAIAEEVGFSDGSHLHRIFVKHYGCTPAHYRERRQALQPDHSVTPPRQGAPDTSSA